MALPALKYDDLYTYADYVTWPHVERWELIEGVPYNMSPAPLRKHQRLSVDDDDVTTVVQPDISVICDPEKLDERGRYGVPAIYEGKGTRAMQMLEGLDIDLDRVFRE